MGEKVKRSLLLFTLLTLHLHVLFVIVRLNQLIEANPRHSFVAAVVLVFGPLLVCFF